MDIDKIVTDGDLDGLLSAAILLRIWPSANVHFTHPAEIRSGAINHIINRKTAVLDLPFHPSCGLHIDHHQTNRPSSEQELDAAKSGCKIIWRNALSAARVCFDTFKETTDLSDFDTWMPMVDRLDGGKITPEEFLSDHPIVWIGRTIDASNIGYCELLLAELSKGTLPQNLASIDEVSNEISKSRAEFENLRNILPSSVSIVDRMAIARIEELGIRTNGYLVTAYVGDDCDACMIVHGYRGGSVTNSEKWQKILSNQ